MKNTKSALLSRRDFLKVSSTASLGLALSACGLTPTALPITTETPSPTNSPQPSHTPTVTSSPTATATPRPPTLRDLADKLGITIGVATNRWNPGNLNNLNAYLSTLAQEFNLVHGMGEFYMENILPAKPKSFTDIGDYTFELSNELVNFARGNKMSVRAEPLIWGEVSNPDWFDNSNYSADELEKILKDYIYTVVGHFGEKIQEWTVVLEPIWEAIGYATTGWHENIWYKKLGQKYLEMAFRAAREANPKAILLIDEGGIELPTLKADLLYRIVRDFKDRDVPIDAVGMEFHLDANQNIDEKFKEQAIKNIKRFKELGLQVPITSLSVNVADYLGTEEEKYQRQGDIFADIFDICMLADCGSYAFWGFTEPDQWEERPTLFDAKANPRISYFVVKERVLTYAGKA